MSTPSKVPPQRTDDNVIVAAYNIQFLGQWTHDLGKLAQVIAHFDVCGLVEVKGEDEIPALVTKLKEQTGEDWGYVFGVRTHRPGGTYHETYGFVWRRGRVHLGDGIVSNIWDTTERFRNDPFVASFVRGKFDFVMGLLHTRWTDDADGTRADEVAAVATQVNWMKNFIPERDLLLAGDFNYSGTHSIMVEMAASADLQQLDDNAKSTFKTDGTGFASSYDHLYVGGAGKDTAARLIGACTTLDACYLVYGDNDPQHMKEARRELSDHLPVFAEFRTT